MIDLHKLKRPDYKNKLNTVNGFNNDIIRAIENNYQTAVNQSKDFAKGFKGSNRLETAKNIWNFLRHSIHYKKDSAKSQLIKLPSRFVHSKNGDCKSYSLFAASILGALKIPVSFRYASYSSDKTPTHVYVTTVDENGKEIIIDGVYKHFNKQKPAIHYINHKMNVYTLSGTEEIGKISFKKLFKGVGKGLKKIGLAIPRRAFRTLVALNVGGLATKLKRAYAKNPAAVESKWRKLGGSRNALQNSFKKGAKRKRIFGIEEELNGMGAAPAIPAILAAAAPIIAAIAPLLKKLGVDQDKAPGENTIDKIESVAKNAAETYQNATGGNSPSYTDPTEEPGKFDAESGKGDDPSGFQLKPIYLVIGAAGLLFLLNKKK